MKLENFDGQGLRIPLARGDVNGQVFILSILIDGRGIVLEFEEEEAYLLPTQEIVAEVLKRIKEISDAGVVSVE